jgi:sn-glycerol 3-phosphate transport system substrate-binding protein
VLASTIAVDRARAGARRSLVLFPVAVGGPITKLIDAYAADFEKENPGIKVKPIYSGTYQDTITKALTAVKGGEPPVTSILLSTDMFTLIDEEAIVPFDDLIKTPDDEKWLKSFYPAFMEKQPDRRQDVEHSRSSARRSFSTGTRKCSRKRARSESRAGQLEGDGRLRAEAHQARCVGQGHAVGVADSLVGLPYWLFQALAIENGVNLMNAAGTETYYDKPEVIEALQYWVDLARSRKCIRRHRRMGDDAEGLLREEDGDDVDDDRAT